MVDVSKIILSISEFNPEDAVRKVGGFHTLVPIQSDVDDVFQPGWKPPSDFPTDTFDQFRKVFWRNETGEILLGCKVYGFNVKSSSNVKFALEKGQDQLPKINGSEAIQNYQTIPTLFGDYHFTELQQADAADAGNSGRIEHQEGQGIWLRQRMTKTTVIDPSDEFLVGFTFESSVIS